MNKYIIYIVVTDKEITYFRYNVGRDMHCYM